MNNRFVRIAVTVISFFFLTGFVPVIAFLGPGITAVTSGNIYKASAQFLIDQKIKKETGKNSFALVKQEIDKKNQQNKFNEDLRELVEKRINITRKKLNFNNIIQ
tara:strand:- start:131 stop:445 length:315 start_codon:yes stop_codon:yes gene_type:complete